MLCFSHLLPREKHHLRLRPRGHSYDILMPFQYAQTTYVNAVLSPDVYYVFCDQCLFCIVQHVHLSLVC